MIKDRAFIAAEFLDDYFGAKDYHELLGEKVADAYTFAMDNWKLYGYEENEANDFAVSRMANTIWNFYDGGDTCYAQARRIFEAWGHSGVL